MKEPKRFRKKPVEIHALQWTGDNADAVDQFVQLSSQGRRLVTPNLEDGRPLTIRTIEGDMQAEHGDWIIRGVQGEVYPCKPDIFESTYEPVEDGQ